MQAEIHLYLNCEISSVSYLSSDHGENSIVIRNAQLGFNQSTIAGFNAVCPNDEDVCCKKILEIDTDMTKNCADDPDYHCVGIQVGEIHNFTQFEKNILFDWLWYDFRIALLGFWKDQQKKSLVSIGLPWIGLILLTILL